MGAGGWGGMGAGGGGEGGGGGGVRENDRLGWWGISAVRPGGFILFWLCMLWNSLYSCLPEFLGLQCGISPLHYAGECLLSRPPTPLPPPHTGPPYISGCAGCGWGGGQGRGVVSDIYIIRKLR